MAKKNLPVVEEEDDELDSEQPERSSPLIPWLIVMSLALLFLPLYLVSATVKDDNRNLSDQADAIGTALNATTGPNPTEKALSGTLVQMKKQAVALEAVKPTLNSSRIDWPAIMLAIGSYDQGQVSVTGMIQTDKQVTLTGVANDENAVMAYAQLLKDSNLFSRVKVQNITVKPSPTPTPSPTATLTPSPVSDNGTSKPVTPTVTPSPTPTAIYDPAAGKFTTFIIQLQPVFATAVTPQP